MTPIALFVLTVYSVASFVMFTSSAVANILYLMLAIPLTLVAAPVVMLTRK